MRSVCVVCVPGGVQREEYETPKATAGGRRVIYSSDSEEWDVAEKPQSVSGELFSVYTVYFVYEPHTGVTARRHTVVAFGTIPGSSDCVGWGGGWR